MTFEPQLIDNTTPGESLRSGADKINENFESIASALETLETLLTIHTHPLTSLDCGGLDDNVTFVFGTLDTSVIAIDCGAI
jgi:hypothetical protein